MSSLIGQSLGPYHIIEQLGEGGMASVYKAYDTHLERDVAIKVIRQDAFPVSQHEQVLKRFEREAKALAKLNHPNIVSVIGYGEHEDSPYLVMPYFPGGTLKQRLGKSMPWQESSRLLLPIAHALQFSHELGIIHRDIKPSNILITRSGEPMLSDFGIAKILEGEETTSLTGTGVGVGTPEYMAPEQWTGKACLQSDIYSLGVVFYEMVTGRKPYIADTPAAILLKQATEPLPRPSKYIPSLSEKVEKVLLKALAIKPENRYQTMGEFATAIENLSKDYPSQPAEPNYAPLNNKERLDSKTQLASLQEKKQKAVPSDAGKLKQKRAEDKARQRKYMQYLAIGTIVIVVSIIAWLAVSGKKPAVTSNPTSSSVSVPTTGEATPYLPNTKQYSSAPPMLIDVNIQYFATIKMAKGGEFVIQLYPDKAPITVNSFVFLAREGFFDGVTFHRVLEGFMAQGGDPTGTGGGGPGYQFVNELNDMAFDKPGVVAMANAGPNTNGSQFFIMFNAYGLRESDYTIFGQVISGMDVVNGITRRDPQKNPDYPGDMIESITITEK